MSIAKRPGDGLVAQQKKSSLIEEMEKAKLDMDYQMVKKIMQEGMATMGMPSRRRTPPNLNEQIEQRLSRIKEEEAKLIDLKEKLKDLQFKVGDVAFHKDYGNVLVRQVLMKDDYSLGRDFTGVEGDFAYEIVTMEGPMVVPTSDLVPITEMTKALYGK